MVLFAFMHRYFVTGIRMGALKGRSHIAIRRFFTTFRMTAAARVTFAVLPHITRTGAYET